MSKITAGPIPSSSRIWQPSTASRASSCAEMMSSRMPVSRRTRSMNSAPLLARRQASVATERARWTLRRLSLSAQILSAPTARSIASSLSRPVWASPSPSRTTRLKASMTTKFSSGGPGDQQAAVVGAEVDRGIGLARGRAARPAAWRRGRVRGGAVALPVAGGVGATGWGWLAQSACLALPAALRRSSGGLKSAMVSTSFVSFHPPGGGTWGQASECAARRRQASAATGPARRLTGAPPRYLDAPLRIAPSSNGKTTNSDSVYRGSNPRGASSFPARLSLRGPRSPSARRYANGRVT